MTDSPDEPRYDPADPRIYFAAERTLLAWVRTGLAMMGFGFVVARFGLFLRMMGADVGGAGGAIVPGGPPGSHPVGPSAYLGTALVVLGVMATLAAAVKHVLTLRRLRCGAPVWQDRVSLEVIVAAVLTVLGAGMSAYLIWAVAAA